MKDTTKVSQDQYSDDELIKDFSGFSNLTWTTGLEYVSLL